MIDPVTLTWQHNTYVTISVDIAADGGLTVYKSAGGGTANNMVICYPQSDTYSAESEITTIPIPQSAGEHSIAITVWWDNQSGAHNDHNNHTLTFTVISSGTDPVPNKVVLADGTVLIDLTSDTAVASDVAQGKTFHLADGTQTTGTGGSSWPPSTITAGDTPAMVSSVLAYAPTSKNNFVASGMSITIPSGKAGTYRFKWGAEIDPKGGTMYTQLYKNGTAIGTQISLAAGTSRGVTTTCSLDVACNDGDVIEVYAKGGQYSTSVIYGSVSALIACIDGDNGF